MSIRDFFKNLIKTEKSSEAVICEIARAISKQMPSDDIHEFIDFIDAAVDAGELEIAVNSLRNYYEEYECNGIGIEEDLVDLETEFAEGIKKMFG